MKKTIISVFLIALLVASMCGCAASESANINKGEIGISGTNSDMSFDGLYNDSSMEMAPDVTENDSKSDISNDTESYLETQKLIYKCDLDIETLEFEKTAAAIKELIKTHCGFIESDSMYDESWDWYYSDYSKDSATMREVIKIRIPTTNYEKFLGEINGIGKVRNKNEQVTNITKSYNDTKTTIAMYEKEEAMLLEMMGNAKTISEMLEVEQRLADVQRKLAIYQSNMNSMETDLAFSTITVEIQEVVQYTQNTQKLTFMERISIAFTESAQNFIEFLEGFTIVVIHAAPYLLTGSLVATIIVFTIKRKKQKKAKMATMHVDCIPTSTKPTEKDSK